MLRNPRVCAQAISGCSSVISTPDRFLDEFSRFPLVSGPDVRVQECIGIAENPHVDASKTKITALAHVLDGGRHDVDVREIADPLAARQIGQTIHPHNLRQCKRVSGEPLRVTDDSECRVELCEYGRISSSVRCRDSIRTPVHHAT